MSVSESPPIASEARRAWRRADALARHGDNTGALAQYERAALGLNDPRVWIQMGRCRHAMGDLEGARAAYGRALTLRPGAMPPRFFQALVEYDAGELERAYSPLSIVIADQEENYAAICMRALIDYRRGQERKALAVMKQRFCSSPDFLSRLITRLAGEFLESGNRAGAATTIPHEAIAALEARLARTHSWRGLLRLWIKLTTANALNPALAAARQMAEGRPNRPEAQLFIVHSLLALDRYDEAQAALNTCRRALRRRAVRRALWPFSKPSLARLRDIIRKRAAAPDLDVIEAFALIMSRRCREAAALLRTVPVVGPESFNKFYYLGLCALGDGQANAARDYFSYALHHFGVDTMELIVEGLRTWAARKHGEAPVTALARD